MELNTETIIKQMQEWSDGICENACLKGERLNGRVVACETCFPNTVRNALALIKKLTEENEAFYRIVGEKIQEKIMLAEENKKLKAELLKIVENDIPALCVKEMLNTHTAAIMKQAHDIGVQNMQERLKAEFAADSIHGQSEIYLVIDQIAKELLEGK